jgi:hypothetical protein
MWVGADIKPSKAKTPRGRYEGLVSEFSLTPRSPYYPNLLIVLIDQRRKERYLEDPSEEIIAYPLTHEIREKSDVANRWGIPTDIRKCPKFCSIPFTLRRDRYKGIKDEGYHEDQFGRCRHRKARKKTRGRNGCSICAPTRDVDEISAWKSTDFGDFYFLGDAYPNGDHCAYPEGRNDDGSSIPCGLITVEPTNFCIKHLENVKNQLRD